MRSVLLLLFVTFNFCCLQAQQKKSPKHNTGKPTAAVLIRGPYLNSAVQTGIVIRWRTDIATDSKVGYGIAANNLNQSATGDSVSTEHIVTLTGLTPNTLYYYSIGTASETLQGDANNYFKTMPVVGSKQKVRFLVMGDMGSGTHNQSSVRDAWLNYNGNQYTDGWLLLGDNAYALGKDAEFQTNFFNYYQGNISKNHVLWPSPGNHDYANSAPRQADHLVPYFDMFTLPAHGEAGGVASNIEAYYAFNYGNIHFVSLDSYGWETGNTRLYDTLGPQAVWLKQDLAANTQPWTVVYFHHPPYTKGSRNSDVEAELIGMRQNIVPILERYKVDLVLSGHSHCYERSFLINGHYGLANTFDTSVNALSASSAKYDGSANSCVYVKNASDNRNGIVYAVVGSSGQLAGAPSPGYPHQAMYYSNIANGGALYLEVEDNRLNAKWICADSIVRDNFTIMKEVNKTTDLSVEAGTAITLTASWPGNYVWPDNTTTRSIQISASTDTIIVVNDSLGCLQDSFKITVTNSGIIKLCPPAANASLTTPVTGSVYQWQVNTGSGFVNISNNTNYAGVNTTTLQLINAISAWYGYKYRCLVDGVATKEFEIQFTDTFTGAAGTAWENPNNWSCNTIPDANTAVFINSGNVILNSNGVCRSISIKPTANLTVVSGFSLTVTK